MAENQERVLERARALASAEETLMDQLVALRRAHSLSQKDVAERLGVTQAAVSQFERYDSNPTLATLRRYALAIEARLEFGVVDDRAVIHTKESAPKSHDWSVSRMRGRRTSTTMSWGRPTVKMRTRA